eukprot:CAMPEP_0115166554 /NCGR_PEP_ID=MMETSP0227-20121206/74186_1 /TAXON_ID=89957 /ORGANISM="Polarella glacialis, Strain CCMP 1383" /LENGTH=74 /DNA_ID=CAMNT_0002579097 /DNA_START=691 /DNA_END=915 /DNA_ORIENTATION=+
MHTSSSFLSASSISFCTSPDADVLVKEQLLLFLLSINGGTSQSASEGLREGLGGGAEDPGHEEESIPSISIWGS